MSNPHEFAINALHYQAAKERQKSRDPFWSADTQDVARDNARKLDAAADVLIGTKL